jgi:high-affinity iron transporter
VRPTRRGGGAAAAVMAAAVLAAWLVTAAGAARVRAAPSTERITFGNTTCAPSWPAPEPGVDRFAVVNRSSRTATVYLFRADSGAIVAQISRLRAGATRRLTVRLTGGRAYAWGCDLAGYPRHVSEADPVPVHRQVGGHGPVVVPVLPGQLIDPLRSYRRYVAARITTLVANVDTLREDIAAGDLAAARADWLTAHLSWLSIGQDDAAYGAFGALGRALDGTAAGLTGGTANPAFTGFHRVELDLWGSGGLPAAGPDAGVLGRLVGRLAGTSLLTALPTSKLGVASWTLRAHEILEDALRDTLSGDDDYGSHTGLASLVADIAATREILSLQAPLITPRAPQLLATAHGELARLYAAIAATRAGGTWVAIAALPRTEREDVDAATGAALETLSRVPDLLRIGTT